MYCITGDVHYLEAGEWVVRVETGAPSGDRLLHTLVHDGLGVFCVVSHLVADMLLCCCDVTVALL